MCGYNTVFELLASGVPNIWLFPRVRDEQQNRTDMLQRRGLARRITGSGELAEMIEELVDSPQAAAVARDQIDLRGAERTADFLYALTMGGSA
jgi:predicted glycosyltransferase